MVDSLDPASLSLATAGTSAVTAEMPGLATLATPTVEMSSTTQGSCTVDTKPVRIFLLLTLSLCYAHSLCFRHGWQRWCLGQRKGNRRKGCMRALSPRTYSSRIDLFLRVRGTEKGFYELTRVYVFCRCKIEWFFRYQYPCSNYGF